jgi:hypothetical protein
LDENSGQDFKKAFAPFRNEEYQKLNDWTNMNSLILELRDK